MRIVSLNAWGGAMYEPLIDWLATCAADVLCLQEVTRTPQLGGWTSFDDGERMLPQRATLFDDVATLLPRHVGTFVVSDAGPVRDGDGRAHRQDFGIATFIHGRLAVLGEQARFVHGSYIVHERWATSERPRAAHAVRVSEPAANRTVTVVHLHGLRDARGKGDTPARRAQAERLAALVERVREADDMTVVCGDLNVLPDSETFAALAELDLVDLVGSADTRSSSYAKPVRHANYLLVSDPGAVRNFEIVEHPEVSDHRPLVLDL